MSKLNLLDFQFKLEMTKQKARKWLSMRDRQASDLTLCYEPNEEEMRKVFCKISGGKDKIDVNDLEALQRKLKNCQNCQNCQPDRKEAEMMLWAADMNKDGAVDFGEFMEVTSRKGGVRQSDIKNAFWAFDRDKDGRISAEEIKKMMMRLGEYCSLEDCERMVKHVGTKSDGMVGMDEFMAMMTATMKRIT